MKTLNCLPIKSGLFLLISLGCFLFSCSTEKNKTKSDVIIRGLKGEVKSLTETGFSGQYVYANKGFHIQKKGIFLNKIVDLFNKDGNTIESFVYYHDGSLNYKVTYKYDRNGKVKRSYFHNSDGKLIGKDEYKNIGNTTTLLFYESDENHSGKLILGGKYIYIYDKRGNKIEEAIFHTDGTMDNKTIYKYDDKGNCIESTNCYKDGISCTKEIFKYDKNGNIMEENIFHSNTPGKFDLVRTLRYKYDDKGNMMEEAIVSTDNLTKKYSYEKFDSHGNWLIQGQIGDLYDRDKVFSAILIEREIEYY